MADAIAVMNQGRIEQLGPPTELYERPATAFVAGLPRRLQPAPRLGHRPAAASGSTRATRSPPTRASARGRVAVGIRPEKIRLGPPGEGDNSLAGTVKETAYVGVATQYVVETGAGTLIVYVQNDGSAALAPARCCGNSQLEPARRLRRRSRRGGFTMTPPLTRRQLLERAALGRRGPDPARVPRRLRRRGQRRRLRRRPPAAARSSSPSTLRFANWQLYIDVDEKTKKRPTLDQFTKKTGVSVDYFEEINSNDEYFGKIQGPLSRGQGIDRDIIVLTDNSRYPGLMVDEGWVEKLDKGAIPNIDNLVDALKKPVLRPRPQLLAAVAVGDDRHRLQREADLDADHLDRPAARGSEAEGQDDASLRDGRHARRRDEGERRRPGRRHRRDVQEGDRPGQGRGRLGPGAPVHRQRLLRAALEGRPDRGALVVGRRRPAPGRQLEPEVGDPEGRRDDLDGQHADPDGRRRLHRLDVHELRLRPEDRRPDRRLRQLRDAGEGRQGGAREDRPGDGGEPARSSRTTRRSRRSRASTRRRSTTRTTSSSGRRCWGRRSAHEQRR